MALSAPHAAAFELRSVAPAWPHVDPVDRLYLRPSDDGWSLLNSAGEVLLRGFGLSGRRQCLEFARALGVLVVFA